MCYRRACALVATTALLASVAAATTSRTQVSPVVHTVAVGSAPLALAVNGPTRRVFVANFGSGTVSMLGAGSCEDRELHPGALRYGRLHLLRP
jgi:DNA-binding beta-propeller fold protein YncE